jgi:hypothetical protein
VARRRKLLGEDDLLMPSIFSSTSLNHSQVHHESTLTPVFNDQYREIMRMRLGISDGRVVIFNSSPLYYSQISERLQQAQEHSNNRGEGDKEELGMTRALKRGLFLFAIILIRTIARRPCKCCIIRRDGIGKRTWYLFIIRIDLLQGVKKSSNPLDKRERLPRGDLINVLLDAFAQYSYWTFRVESFVL